MHTEAWLPGRDGIKFYTRTYAAASPRAAVLFMHGFAEYVARYEWAHGVYASRGVTVFAFDQRGFGMTALDRENKSAGSKYGKTSWNDQFADIEWWLKYVKDQYPSLPVFLMGHSMGGALCLGFMTRKLSPPSTSSTALVSGVISTSPLLLLSTPPLRILRFLGMLASQVVPSFVIPAPVDPNALTHDAAVNEANARDPLCPQKGSVKGIHDMLTGGEQLVWNDYQEWPTNMPMLLVHGTADKACNVHHFYATVTLAPVYDAMLTLRLIQVTSFAASKDFYEKVSADDKELLPMENGYHELVHECGGMKERFVSACIDWILKHSTIPEQ